MPGLSDAMVQARPRATDHRRSPQTSVSALTPCHRRTVWAVRVNWFGRRTR